VGATCEIVFADGRLCHAICTHYDALMDCALLHIQSVYTPSTTSSTSSPRRAVTTTTEAATTASTTSAKDNDVIVYPYISLPSSTQYLNGLADADTSIMCVGQPGREDLESKRARATNYPLVNISFGHLCGYQLPTSNDNEENNDDDNDNDDDNTTESGRANNGDSYLDNSEIGCLKHNAWTYWVLFMASPLCYCL
jgi:hypothetical protein